MTTVYKVLGQNAPSANTLTTLYTVPAGNSAVLSTISICNQYTGNANVSIAICPANTSATTAQYIVNTATIVPYYTIFLTLGVTLAATDTIRVNADQANVAFGAFGSEVY